MKTHTSTLTPARAPSAGTRRNAYAYTPQSLDPKIQTALETAKISRYYAITYAAAEKSTKLDGKLFAKIEEQQRYFRERRERSEDSLRGNLIALRVICTDLLTKTTDADDRAVIESQITSLDSEIARLK